MSRSPQIKRNLISSVPSLGYEFPNGIPNNLRLTIRNISNLEGDISS